MQFRGHPNEIIVRCPKCKRTVTEIMKPHIIPLWIYYNSPITSHEVFKAKGFTYIKMTGKNGNATWKRKFVSPFILLDDEGQIKLRPQFVLQVELHIESEQEDPSKLSRIERERANKSTGIAGAS